MASPGPPQPIQYAQLTKKDLESGNLGFLNTMLSQVVGQVNALIGAAGKTVLPAGIDVAGSAVSGLGAPSSSSDAVSLGHAESNYSALAISQQLESGGKASLKTYRALNSKAQSESNTTWLNRLSNTSPTCNTSDVSATAPSGGSVTVTVTAGYHKFPDGTIIPYGTFSDTIPVASTQSITSMTRVSGVVTASGTFTGLSAGDSVYVTGASDSTFNGTWMLVTASGSTLTWSQLHQPNSTATGGTVSTGGVYHFYLKNPSHQLAVAGPFGVDTQENRLSANIDQQVLIAVVTIDGAGLVANQSAAGGTPPAATSNFRLISRM